ncbi:outer membrane beta-barrel protein [Flavobacterium amniphilum]|uniref:outer membrane beta-barrel protein n=1 Tax=Flavobacterium amniphilum TaxID=1834035 RepID=UPI00202A9368|nr:outer membrane beta-barrel protein [Flavobacterium amniphilum]MCL9803907.1 outer membrane beta-barrel protein [Flavobacterium amniphilum]
MNDRKKIERLFQEKFKDFEVTPPPGVWDGIASQLEKKKEKRRIFPFWFNAKAAGIAAALVLGLFVLNNNQGWVNWNFNEASSDKNTVVEKGNASDKTTSKGINGEKPVNELPSGLNGNPNSNERIVSATETETDTQRTQNTSITNTDEFSTQSTSAKSQQTKSQSPSYISNQKSKTSAVLVHTEQNQSKSSGNTPSTSIANRQKTNSDNHSNDVDTNAPQLNVSQIADAGNLKKTEKEKQQTVKDEQLVQIAEIPNSKKETIVNHKDNAVVQKEALTVDDVKDKNQIAERKGVSDNVERINNEGISKDNKDLVNPKGIAVADELKNKNAVNEKNSISDASSDKGNQLNNDLKNSAIVQKDIVINPLGKEKKDSVVVAQVEENPLEKILKEKEKAKEKEKEEIVETPYSKWGVRPTIAALFSGSTQGSPISPEFADNDKTYDSKFGLGIGVDYRLSKKIAIRTGVSKIDMAYNTEGISFFTDLSGRMSSQRTMRNINRNAASENVIIQDRPRSTLIEVAFASNDVGVMKQELGYIEIPMEMSYKIVDKKFGLHLITGLSTLFLSDNKISIMSNGMTTEIGEANNLNKVHFSTNIGLGIKYNILKALEASVEPMFKYQINTFSNDSGSFRPFVMGVYSGLSYKF